MHSSQHKLALRVCPGCLIEKEFPARNTVCSNECFGILRSKVAADAPTFETSEVRREAGNDLTLELGKTTVRTLDQLLAVCEVDLNIWRVKDFEAKKWSMGSIPRTTGNKREGWSRPCTKPVVTDLYAVRARFERRVVVIAVRSEIEALKADAMKAAVRSPAPKFCRHSRVGQMLELNSPDLHMGKLAWGKETGWQDYDSKIAAACFNDAMDTLMQRSASYRLSEIVLVVGNDLLNSDNKANTTTAGTPMSGTDTRFHKTFLDTRRMIAATIRKCRMVAPVRVVMVSGNHDELSVWHLGDSLECEFSKTAGVFIDNAPTARKYYQFGQVGLMWTHSDKGKKNNYPLLFATEKPDIWGTTRFREIHTGHTHESRLMEYHGTRVRTLSALCAPDAWHAENAYVGNLRSAEGFIWDREEGLIGTCIYTTPETAQGPQRVGAKG